MSSGVIYKTEVVALVSELYRGAHHCLVWYSVVPRSPSVHYIIRHCWLHWLLSRIIQECSEVLLAVGRFS